MLKVEVDAHKTATCAIQMSGTLEDVFVDSCLFVETVYEQIKKSADKEVAEVFLNALKEVIDCRLNGELPQAVNAIELDMNAIELIKKLTEENK